MTQASRYRVSPDDMRMRLVEDRRASAELSPWGIGNSKVGSGIDTYSKLPVTTCPGASQECLAVCYARKLDPERMPDHPVWRLWAKNTERGDEVPPLPYDAQIIRFHVSGDFDTVEYVRNWTRKAIEHPDVTFFGYTRSWRVPKLRASLDLLRLLPNVHVWASVDLSTEVPPIDNVQPWRRAWIEGDSRLTKVSEKQYRTFDGRKAIICPEGVGLMPNCQTCRFCFLPHRMDLVFPKH